MRVLQKISSVLWFLLMVFPLALSVFEHKIFRSAMIMFFFIVVELWYFFVFESSRIKSEEHYTAVRSRFMFTFYAMVALSLLSFCFDILHVQSVISAEAVGMISFAVVLLRSLFVVWQLVILVSACTYDLSPDEFRSRRVNWYLSFLLAPAGVFWVTPQILQWNKK